MDNKRAVGWTHFLFRYVEVFESRMSVMERVKKTSSDGGVRGKDAARDRDRGFRGERGFGDRDRGFGGDRADRGFGRGREVSNYCVRLRGLPWEAKKVRLVFFVVVIYLLLHRMIFLIFCLGVRFWEVILELSSTWMTGVELLVMLMLSWRPGRTWRLPSACIRGRWALGT